jgi:FPC/CPF motif-containing protein YcgG
VIGQPLCGFFVDMSRHPDMRRSGSLAMNPEQDILQRITAIPPGNAGLVRAFEALVERKSFPCLGAKAALNRQALECVCASDICSPRQDRRITREMQSFVTQTMADDVFVSKAILFPCSPLLSEIAFEVAMWERLRAIHLIDREQHDWDSSVSDDPQSPHFSMSIGGRGFFVIGMHPRASRQARRFQCPVMVFNLHSQFEHLRTDGRYGKLSAAIIARDVMFSGSSNPMLAVHGQRSEARQYSGRQVDDDWACPFVRTTEEFHE